MRNLVMILFVWVLGFNCAFAEVRDTTTLVAKPVYGKEARVIAYILDNNHYRKIKLNDSLSSIILDRFINELDNNKTYFLESDIKPFEKYRTSIDDLTRNENVQPAYEIYAVFKKRYAERMDYALNKLVNEEFDYTIDEYYETNREKQAWVKSEAEMNDLWRKIIKSQMLSLRRKH
jgi:carboxyl-terminal processing protease